MRPVGPGLLLGFAWPEAEVAALRERASQVDDLAARWADTEVGSGSFLAVRSPAEADELTRDCEAAVAAAGA